MLKKIKNKIKMIKYCKNCNGTGKKRSTPTKLNIQIYETTCGVCYGTGRKKDK